MPVMVTIHWLQYGIESATLPRFAYEPGRYQKRFLACLGFTFIEPEPHSPEEVKYEAYELLFLVSPTLEEEVREATFKRIDSAITAQGGVVDKVEEWGKRKLAFEVNRLTDGDYSLIDFHADPKDIAEIDRVLRITDAVVRFMIVRREDRD